MLLLTVAAITDLTNVIVLIDFENGMDKIFKSPSHKIYHRKHLAVIQLATHAVEAPGWQAPVTPTLEHLLPTLLHNESLTSTAANQ